MNNEIKNALKQAMGKLTSMSLNEQVLNGCEMEVAIHSRFDYAIWVVTHVERHINTDIIDMPGLMCGVPAYLAQVEKLMSDLEIKFKNSNGAEKTEVSK